MLKKVLIPVGVLVVVLGAAFWWFIVRDDAPPELTLDSGSDSGETSGTVPESLDGTWSVVAGDTTAGFRINETFGGGLVDHEAVGRSGEVTGSIEIAGTEITTGSFTVDLTALSFTDDPGRSVGGRENAMKSRGLETNDFPDASFELTAPVDFGAKPEAGETVTAEATGDLTIHGVTNEVTFTIEAEIAGDSIRVVTQEPVPVALADYDITPPTGGPIAEISDEGSFEFLIVLNPG